MQPLFESPSNPNHRSPLHLHDAIVPTRLDDLAIHTGWPKDLPYGFFIELESVRDNQRSIFEIPRFIRLETSRKRANVLW